MNHYIQDSIYKNKFNAFKFYVYRLPKKVVHRWLSVYRRKGADDHRRMRSHGNASDYGTEAGLTIIYFKVIDF